MSLIAAGREDAPAPPLAYTVWVLAERFGWSLEYAEGLPVSRIAELAQIDDARAKAGKSILKHE